MTLSTLCRKRLLLQPLHCQWLGFCISPIVVGSIVTLDYHVTQYYKHDFENFISGSSYISTIVQGDVITTIIKMSMPKSQCCEGICWGWGSDMNLCCFHDSVFFQSLRQCYNRMPTKDSSWNRVKGRNDVIMIAQTSYSIIEQACEVYPGEILEKAYLILFQSLMK